MPNAWFRFYHEWDSDPKVQMMSEAMQRRLAMLFCWRCKGETFHETRAAFHWRVTPADMTETKELFMRQGFIDEDWNLLNWNRRQFLSDSSTDRVRRYRQSLKQNETLHETVGNVTVTAPDTDTDTDTEQKKLAPSPKKQGSTPPATLEPGLFELPLADKTVYEVPADLYREYVAAFPGVSVMGELARMRTWLLSNRKSMKTRKGMPRFMNTWLDKEQNRNGGRSNGKSNGKTGGNGIFDDLQKLREQNGGNHNGDTVAPSAPRQTRESHSGGSVGPRAPELW